MSLNVLYSLLFVYITWNCVHCLLQRVSHSIMSLRCANTLSLFLGCAPHETVLMLITDRKSFYDVSLVLTLSLLFGINSLSPLGVYVQCKCVHSI